MILNKSSKIFAKGLSLCPKLKCSNPYIFATSWCKTLIFKSLIIGSNIIHSLKYLRSVTLWCKDIGIKKYEIVTKTQFLYITNIFVKVIENVRVRSHFRCLNAKEIEKNLFYLHRFNE